MKKVIRIVLIVLIPLTLMVVFLPTYVHKDTCPYDDTVKKYAPGELVTVNNKKVHYIVKGEGKPVIMIHGFLYHTVMWKKNIDALAQKYRVYAIDLWGWGYSERLAAHEYSFELYMQEVVGFMDAMKIDKATLVGQSMGGGTAVKVAANYPDRVDKLILVDAAVLNFELSTTAKIYAWPFVGEFMNMLPGDYLMKNNLKTIFFYDPNLVTDEYAAEVLRPLCIAGSYDGAMYIHRSVLKPPMLEKEAALLEKMNIPVLLIHGRQDEGVSLDKSEKLHQMWKNSKLVIFENAKHTPHEEYPEKFNTLALEFLSAE